MRKYVIFISLILFVMNAPISFASQSASYYFAADAPPTKAVAANGGNINAVINVDTGALSAAFTPAFTLTTNTGSSQALTMKAEANTQGGLQNAVLDAGAVKYIILTNSNILPPVSSLTDIKTGSPTAASNPNAIAYTINNPAAVSGRLTVAYNSGNKNWDLVLFHNGTTNTSITVPSGTPFTNTYSTDDEPGSYQAIITLSFNN